MKFKYLMTIASVTCLLFACKQETREKFKQAKEDVSNVTSVIGNAKKVQEDAERLKDLTPLTNEQLKNWLPENVEGMDRTGFKVGKNGYMNVSSIEGTFKGEDRQVKVEIMDGAGPTGSMLVMSLGFAANMEMEEEDENKHLQTMTHKGLKAQQTYYKKRNNTKVQFLYEDRFAVIVNAKGMNPEETWEVIENLNLNKLKS